MSKKEETQVLNSAVETVNETAQEFAKRMQDEVDTYKETLESITDVETLNTMESELMVEMDAFDAYIKDVRYTLPTSCEFEGTKYSKSDVAGKIIYFISKFEQTWQYVLGLYELCRIWKNNPNEITFGVMDSTLRLLDQCKFKGMTEWKDILIINEFMKTNHEEYAKDTTKQIALGHKHNDLMTRRDTLTGVTNDETAE